MIIKECLPVITNQLPQDLADAYVPAVPARQQAIIDELLNNPIGNAISAEDRATVLYRLSKIHLAAIICQYGAPPKEVGFFRARSVDNGVAEDRILVRYLYPQIEHAAFTWLEAVSAGLSTWEEAGFSDPLEVQWLDGTPINLVLNEVEDVIVHQLNRYRLDGNDRGVTRLISFMSRVMDKL